MNGEIRNLLRETVVQFCLNNINVSVQDDGENFLIIYNEKSITAHLVSHEIDLYNGEIEIFDFELEIMVWAEIRTDSLLTNQIREFIKSLSDRIILALQELKKSQSIRNKAETAKKKARLLKQKEAKKAGLNNVQVEIEGVFVWS